MKKLLSKAIKYHRSLLYVSEKDVNYDGTNEIIFELRDGMIKEVENYKE